MLTCFGPLSRNRTVGVRFASLLLHVLLEFNCIRLGKGETMKSIMSDRSEVAEGKCLWLERGDETELFTAFTRSRYFYITSCCKMG